MIAAPFLAGCASVVDRAVWSIIGGGMLDAIAWPPDRSAGTLFLIPTLVVFLLAVWAWHVRGRKAAAGVALLAVAIHPPLLVAIAPLLAPRRGDRISARLAIVPLVIVVMGSLALLQAAPECRVQRTAPLDVVASGILVALLTNVGLIAGLLALLETIRSPKASHTRVAWMVMACSVTSAFAFQRFDARVTLLPATAALWWLAAAAGVALTAARRHRAARVGSVLILALVPVLQAWKVSASLPSRSAERHMTAATVVAALDKMWKPALLVTEDGAHDFLATVWAAGHGRRGAFLEIVADANGVGLGRPLYAFARGTERLTARGLLMAPVDADMQPSEVVLWRALSNERCEVLGREWIDLTPLTTNGQITGVFEEGATGRHAVMWAALPRRATIGPIGWPQIALPGLRIQGFDLTNPDERGQYFQAALADDLPLTFLPRDTGVVARVILGRMERSPGALGVAFESLPTGLVGRLDHGANADRLELCGSAQDLAVVGYNEAPTVASLMVTSPAVVGVGWHAPERVDHVRFRWTAAGEAELRFIALEPVHLALRLHVINAAAGGQREAEAVALNGVPARCEPLDERCDWVLPIEAVKVGLNVITLRAPVSRSSPGSADLGLQITDAELRRLR